MSMTLLLLLLLLLSLSLLLLREPQARGANINNHMHQELNNTSHTNQQSIQTEPNSSINMHTNKHSGQIKQKKPKARGSQLRVHTERSSHDGIGTPDPNPDYFVNWCLFYELVILHLYKLVIRGSSWGRGVPWLRSEAEAAESSEQLTQLREERVGKTQQTTKHEQVKTKTYMIYVYIYIYR